MNKPKDLSIKDKIDYLLANGYSLSYDSKSVISKDGSKSYRLYDLACCWNSIQV